MLNQKRRLSKSTDVKSHHHEGGKSSFGAAKLPEMFLGDTCFQLKLMLHVI